MRGINGAEIFGLFELVVLDTFGLQLGARCTNRGFERQLFVYSVLTIEAGLKFYFVVSLFPASLKVLEIMFG